MVDNLLSTLNIFSPDRLPLALVALIASLLIGVFNKHSPPILWSAIDLAFGGLGDRLDRKQRKRADLVFRGSILLAFILAGAIVIVKAGLWATFIAPYDDMITILLLAITMTTSAVWGMQHGLYKALKNKTVGQGAYYTLARAARYNLSTADDYTITRAAITHGGKMITRGLVAPLFWYLVLGLSAAWLYAVLAGFAWRFGKSGFGTGFAGLATALRNFMEVIPAFIASIAVRIAAFITPGAKAFTRVKGKGVVPSIAGALNLSLGGVFQDITGSAIKGEWIGPEGASAQCNHHHLKRAIFLSIITYVVVILSLLVLLLINNGNYPPFMLDFIS